MTAPIIIRDAAGRDLVMGLVSKLNLDKPWSVTINPYVKKRSLDQNALMWKLTTLIAEETGHSKDEMHSILTHMFLAPRSIEYQGTIYERYETKNLPTDEMSAYIERLYAFAAGELGLLLPIPEEMYA